VDAIYHLAIAENWHVAEPVGEYRQSTIERTLEEEGFIHCSFADQVKDTAARFYAGRDDVLLLMIDPTLVPSEIKVEGGFPHIYGPLPVDAVIEVSHLT
jgi:uncharacterized protein (DUF952 family)